MGETDAVKQAKNILQEKSADPEGLTDPKKILDLATKELKKEKAFDYARRVLGKARQHPSLIENPEIELKLAQQQALCTYKDQNLSAKKRFDRALSILGDVHDKLGDPLGKTKNQETLGLAGAINKYRWEISGQKQHLEQSLNYYLRGYREEIKDDYGYTAINAAFVLDLVASIESVSVKKDDEGHKNIEQRREEARSIRKKIIEQIPPLAKDEKWLNGQWWFLVTLGEAYFGLGQYEEAETWYKKAVSLPNVPDWEKESTTRQLAALARIQSGDAVWESDFKDSPAGKVLGHLVSEYAFSGMLLGKVGLALSGGGFRASLFHIGVLARLAELDMLRHVEVVSCVSGGSIIGAHYYLELREELKKHSDKEMVRKNYIKLVHRVSERFLEGVQRNLRTRVAAEFLSNLKMIFLPNYSRTMRIGELYERDIFSKVEDGQGTKPRRIRDIFVKPKNEQQDFAPKMHNWRRNAKVPMLILNATTINTGHNWQFTASWMGEPPANIDPDIDTNYRLRRMYYSEAPKKHQNIRLGHAVAASSCVPGLFEPLALPGLYPKKDPSKEKPERITVRLVDGGVHDNQGVASLLEQGCSVMLVSDASGQMEAQNDPSRNIIGVPMRSNSILMARVREAEYRELDARRQSAALRGLMFVHLKKDLDVTPVDWVTCQESPEIAEKQRDIERSKPLTCYGIQKDIQQALADIRTDLDSFSKAEAYALMLSGYRMTEYEFPRAITGVPSPKSINDEWLFLAVDAAMKKSKGHEAEHKELKRLLEVGSSRTFRIWKLITPLKVTAWGIGIAALLAFLFASWQWSNFSLLNLGTVGTVVITLLAGGIVGKTIVKIVRFRDTLIKMGIGVGMSLFGWIAARLHLYVFDILSKNYGEIAALKKRAEKNNFDRVAQS